MLLNAESSAIDTIALHLHMLTQAQGHDVCEFVLVFLL